MTHTRECRLTGIVFEYVSLKGRFCFSEISLVIDRKIRMKKAYVVRPRLHLGRFLIRLGRFIQSLAVMVMRPDDLMAFGQLTYARAKSMEEWQR